ncbi:MAG TPA: deoxyribonuclease IV [Nitrososphaeraceae archaeon]|jgi:deoxyribonuclease-4|nr:deoxyribonuclease IV [Nitrososphaeraceae archaeon]
MSNRIGFHVSISGGISNSVNNALKIGCNAFQIFSRSPRGWAAKALLENDVKDFRTKLNDSKIDKESVFVHMPYLPNLSSPNSRLHRKSTNILIDELKRASILGIRYVILHLGSHGGKGNDNGINQLIKACNVAFENYDKLSSSALAKTVVKNSSKKKSGGNSTKQNKPAAIILENSAGEKNSIGSKFNELGLILDKLRSSYSSSSGRNKGASSFGVCFDTCHAFAAGYDLRTEYDVSETLDKFSSEIGLKNLKVIHLNDSKDKLNSNRDRHEHIGLGKIGKEGFRVLLNHKSIKRLPIIMETPVDSKRGNTDNLKVVLDLLDKNKRETVRE